MDISCASHRIWERDNLVGETDDALQVVARGEDEEDKAAA